MKILILNKASIEKAIKLIVGKKIVLRYGKWGGLHEINSTK